MFQVQPAPGQGRRLPTLCCIEKSITYYELPGQVERLMGVMPGLSTASCQTTDFAEARDPAGLTLQPAGADTFADRLLQQRTPLHAASLECSSTSYCPSRAGTPDDS
jgi:hypothetical protein